MAEAFNSTQVPQGHVYAEQRDVDAMEDEEYDSSEAPLIWNKGRALLTDIWTTTVRYPSAEQEASFLAFSQPTILIPAGYNIVNAVITVFGVIATGDGTFPARNVPTTALLVVLGIAGIVLHVSQSRFNVPLLREFLWFTASFLWITQSFLSLDIRDAFFCTDGVVFYVPPPSSNTTVAYRFAQCQRTYIDSIAVSAVIPLLIGSPRFIIVAPLISLYYLVGYWAFRWYYRGGADFYPRDGFLFWWVAFISAMLLLREYRQRQRFMKRQAYLDGLQRAVNAATSIRVLLANLLSPNVLARLVRNVPVFDAFQASVLYSDIAGFTNWASTREAALVVRMLNSMFRAFDAELVAHGVEKVTTIGDAYWAACGIPTSQVLHAHRLCAFGLAMQRAMELSVRPTPQLEGIHIRVGIDSGLVWGAITGQRQFAYQVFGPVNEHSELMEQLAPVDGLLISGRTLASLNETLELFTAGDAKITVRDGPVPESYVLLAGAWDPHAHGDDTMAQAGADAEALLALLEKDTGEHATHAKMDGEDLANLREAMGQRACSGPFLQFADVDLEAAFKTYCDEANASLFPASGICMATLFVVLAIMLLSEGHGAAEWLVWVGCFVLAALDVLSVVFHQRLNLLVAWFRQPLEFCTLLALVSTISRYSLIATQVHYLYLVFASLVVFIVPPRLPWLIGMIFAMFAIGAPAIIVQVVRGQFPTYVVLAALPGFGLATVVAFYRTESQLRSQFLDEEATLKAQEQRQREETSSRSLLDRTMPAFVMPEVLAWLETDRLKAISHTYPDISIGFIRTLGVPHKLVETHADGQTVFQTMTSLVATYEEVLSDPRFGEQVVKIKTIGDILLVCVGLAATASGSASQSTRGSARLQSARSGRRRSSYLERRGTTTGSLLGTVGALTTTQQKVCIAASFCYALLLRVNEVFGETLAAGVHCGPVNAGVLGETRLIFDVFGDTVNTASRVMSTGGGHNIWLSGQACHALLTTAGVDDASVSMGTPSGEVTLGIGPACYREMKGKGKVLVRQVTSVMHGI